MVVPSFMAYSPHFLLQFGGKLGTTSNEIWSCGIRLWSTDYGGFDEVAYLTTVAVPALAAWLGRATSKISSSCSLTFAKMNPIGADGHYSDPGVTNEYFWATPPTGGGGSGTLPFQASVVLGWRTNERSRGPASKGRIYSPAPVVSTNALTGLFVASDALGMATSAATLLNTLDVGFDTDVLRPSIMSAIGGAHSQIDSVVVDNRVDIQRRRANQIIAAESVVPITY